MRINNCPSENAPHISQTAKSCACSYDYTDIRPPVLNDASSQGNMHKLAIHFMSSVIYAEGCGNCRKFVEII